MGREGKSYSPPVTLKLRRGFLMCPVCGHDCLIRDSEHVTDRVKDLWVLCSNVACGASFKWQMELVWQISPSAIDRPDLDLPQAPESVRKRLEAKRRDDDPGQSNIFDHLYDEDSGETADDDADPSTGPPDERRAATG